MSHICLVPSAVGSPTTTKEQQQPRWNYYGHHFSRDENRIKSSISRGRRGGLWQSNNGDDMGRPLLKKPSSYSSPPPPFGKAQVHTIALIYIDLYFKAYDIKKSPRGLESRSKYTSKVNQPFLLERHVRPRDVI